jgi:tetratricopeptide (TPR) repeat protein
MKSLLRLKNSHFRYLLLLVLGAILLSACSAERHNPISKGFHNTTARYNAYFYAKERIKEIEDIINESAEENYNEILKVYPKFDTALSATFKTQIEDCIKKASISIQIHKNSKWVDDSYNLIGLARFYDGDFVNAIETFKYVNTKSEDDNARHTALAHLLRVFTEYKEYNNAVAVSDYLKKETLNTENQKLLYLNKAHLYQMQGDYDNMVQNLALAAPLLSHSEGQARIYFIIGQIYQMLGFASEAYNNDRLCLSNNPAYELYFHARLNIAQVTELSRDSDVKNVRRHFRKLLTDKKNREFKDKIYYEMAEFESRQNNINLALEYYSSSANSSINNDRQKGMSYLKTGMIYYDTLKDYAKAKAYYDSTIQVLPTDFEDYEKIKQRKEVLDEFVIQLNTIKLQDSLLLLSTMDSIELTAKINLMLDEQEAEKQQKEARAKKKALQTAAYISPFESSNQKKGGSSWYFNNPSAVSFGQAEFKRKWGNRKLEDHWRRANNTSDISAKNNTPNSRDDVPPGESATNIETEAIQDNSVKAAALIKQIPFSSDAKQKALDQIEEAFYKLGNIYHFDLIEDQNAANSFEELLRRFAESEYEPEVLYLLYIFNNDRSDLHKERLLAKYPKSTYAKLIANPQYTEESNENNAILKKIYKEAYQLYKDEKYGASRGMVTDALSTYPETAFTANVKLLNILLTGKLESDDKYKYELDTFIKENPNSDITPYALTLQRATEEFNLRIEKEKSIQFVSSFDQIHYFVIVYESQQNITDKLITKLKTFNDQNYGELNLNTGSLSMNDKYSIALVTEFGGIESSLNYLTKYDEGKKGFEILSNSKINTFVITKDNFGILYKSGGVKEYLKFFSQNY